MKIYTKTGDKGQTSLFGGKRVPKNSLRIEAYGTVDELNSVIGVIREFTKELELDTKLEREQNNLLRLGADLATPNNSLEKIEQSITRIIQTDIDILEEEIDEWDTKLPKLTNFILPGGPDGKAYMHLARTVCRRAERRVVELAEIEEINVFTQVYLNRLSDWWFIVGRK